MEPLDFDIVVPNETELGLEMAWTGHSLRELKKQWFIHSRDGAFIVIKDRFTGNSLEKLYSIIDVEKYVDSFENPRNDPINPQHYKNFVKEMQWIEVQQHISKDFEALCEGMQRKYIDRRGKKGDELEDLKKAK